MSGACRESCAVWINWRHLLRWRTWKYSRRLIFEDNVMPLVCWLVGHSPYNTSTIHDPAEHACRRCHRWLRHLDPPRGASTPSHL